MEHPDTTSTCLLCGEPTARRMKETHTDSGVVYQLYRCEVCSAEFWTPFKNPGASWYEHDERYADRNQDPILTPNKKHTGIISYLEKRHGTVLDVGCGVGNFLAFAKAKGFETVGIDFDADAIRAAKETFGLDALTVEDLRSFRERTDPHTFDVITFFDVFEHLDNHQEFLDDVKVLLKKDGVIALSVPYRNAWRWLVPADLPPRHLTRWDEKALRCILERNGFSIEQVRKLPATFYYLVMKLRFKYGALFSFNLVGALKKHEQKKSVSTGSRTKDVLSLKVWFVHKLAQAKDIVLFGVPAGLLWIVLFFLDAKNTDICIIARRTSDI